MSYKLEENYVLKNRYIFKGTIRMETGLHLGGGRPDAGFSDSPVLKKLDGTPFIPGSSFKGAFRSAVERIAPNISSDIKCCSFALDSDYPCLTVNKILQKKYNEERKNLDKDKNLCYLNKNLCDTCKLFGSPYTGAKVYFSDLYVTEEDLWGDVAEVRDGVVIDRDSGRAVDRLKFDYEVVPAGIEFSFTITSENATDKEIGFLAIGIQEFKNGMIQLGGIKTRGLGRCVMENMEVKSINFTDAESLKKYLIEKEMKSEDEKFLEDKITTLFLRKGESYVKDSY